MGAITEQMALLVEMSVSHILPNCCYVLIVALLEPTIVATDTAYAVSLIIDFLLQNDDTF